MKRRNISQIYFFYNFKKSARRFPKFFKFTALEYKFCDKGNFCESYKNLSQNFSYEKIKRNAYL